MAADRLDDGQPDRLTSAGRFCENRGFGDPGAHIKPNCDQRDRDQERHPPAPGDKFRVRQETDEREDPDGQQVTDDDADRRPAAIDAPPAGRRIFDGKDHGSGVFRAGTEALNQAQHHQRRRRPNASACIGRQEPDQKGADTDQQQGGDQHRLAAEPVAEMAEKQSAERAGDKSDAECGKSREGADRRIEFGEERLVEDEGGCGTVDEKIVPFERRPYRRGKRYAGERGPARARGRSGIADRHWFSLPAPAGVCPPHVFIEHLLRKISSSLAFLATERFGSTSDHDRSYRVRPGVRDERE